VLVPLILAYTAYAYWVFRGKTGVFYRWRASSFGLPASGSWALPPLVWSVSPSASCFI